MKILFWNTKNTHLVSEIAELVCEEDCDIAGFSETSDEAIERVILELNTTHSKTYFFQSCPGCDRIKLIVKDELSEVTLLHQHKYYSLIKIVEQNVPLIIGFVHFPSKLHHSLDEIRSASEDLNYQVIKEEGIHMTGDTIIIGDFNIDPFEMPMISFSGMSATNSKDSAINDSVTRAQERKRLFYNPMWTLYSSYNTRPGTHKYRRTGEDVITWHFLDQVIIRPSLIDKFDFGSLKLILSTSSYNFTNSNGRPHLSDHLPLACQITI